MSTISLTTDFGTKDWYAGVLKGVIYNIYPSARMVDITHEIKNHSIEHAAFVIASTYSYFSYGSIHVGIVDPGVGGSREPILLESRGHYFIGPDNGIFTLVDHSTSVLYALDKKQYWLSPVSETFHGRDIFAPVAAYLARGVPADQLGTRVKRRIISIDIPKPRKEPDGTLRATVVHVDRFGNCVTNIPGASLLLDAMQRPVQIHVGNKVISSLLVKTYDKASNSDPVLIAGSTGFLELSLNKDPFAQRYGVSEADPITLKVDSK